MMAQVGAVNSQGSRAWWRLSHGSGEARSGKEAQLGLMKLRPRYRQGLGCTGLLAGQQNWRLSQAGSNSGSGSRRRQNWELQGFARGGGNMK